MTEPAAAVTVGIANDVVVEVTDAMTPGHVAALVISTPSLVSIIEGACRRAVLAHLPAGHDTVGTHVCVSHEGVALVGQSISVRCELTEVKGRHLLFAVSVDGPSGAVSRGTHRRAIVDPSRFARADKAESG
jgi:fluoroacetyl-CoA thioesterase